MLRAKALIMMTTGKRSLPSDDTTRHRGNFPIRGGEIQLGVLAGFGFQKLTIYHNVCNIFYSTFLIAFE